MDDKTLEALEAKVTEVFWDYLKRDPEHKDRRQTGWGTKTKEGLARTIHRIVNEADPQIDAALLKRIKFSIIGLATMGTLKADHRAAHDEIVQLAMLLQGDDEVIKPS